jgi:hypothetical protein
MEAQDFNNLPAIGNNQSIAIGYRIKNGEWIVDEISIVSNPADPNCFIRLSLWKRIRRRIISFFRNIIF